MQLQAVTKSAARASFGLLVMLGACCVGMGCVYLQNERLLHCKAGDQSCVGAVFVGLCCLLLC